MSSSRSNLFILALILWGCAPAYGQRTSDRIHELENYHGYYPCSDCHADQETNPRPRFLVDEHYEPIEWEDSTGATRIVEFGELVSFADLLGAERPADRRAEDLRRIGERLHVAQFMEDNGYAPEDSIWTMTHGGANLWCLDCHDGNDRDSLIKMNEEALGFNESQFLCGQCHGPELRDWEMSIHGRTDGFWDARLDLEQGSTRLLCVECHTAHAPRFRPMQPLAAPVARLDNLPASARPHEAHRGEYDELGPHLWMEPQAGVAGNEDHPEADHDHE